MPTRFDTPTNWLEFIELLLTHPLQFLQLYWLWVVAVMGIFVVLARLNNRIADYSTVHAVSAARGLSGSITAIFIAPIAIWLFLNVIALFYGFPIISLWGVWEAVRLTFSTLYWLGQCLFDSRQLTDNEELYDINAIIRIVWITTLLGLIVFLRKSSTALAKGVFAILVLATLVVTRHKSSPDPFFKQYLPAWLLQSPTSPNIAPSVPDTRPVVAQNLPPQEQAPPAGAAAPPAKSSAVYRNVLQQAQAGRGWHLLVLLPALLGLVMLLRSAQQRGNGIALLVISGVIFVLVAPSNKQADKSLTATEARSVALDQLNALLHDFDELYNTLPPDGRNQSLELSATAMRINALIREFQLPPPTARLCRNADYTNYFYDYCHANTSR